MDFNHSDEQRMLADTLRRFIDSDYGFERRRAIVRSASGRDAGIWSTLAEVGVTGLLIDPEFGGFGEGAASLLVVQRELGRGLMSEPVTPSAVMATQLLQRFGGAQHKRQWLPALASGSVMAAVACLEAQGRFDIGAVACRARLTADGYVLSGSKCLVWHGDAADLLIVSACIDGDPGASLFLLPMRGAAGLALTAYPTMDGHRAADLRLSEVRVPADALLGAPGQGLQALQVGIDWGVAALCAEAAGAMERLIEITVEYLRTRTQFGQALGGFQALQHRVADMLVQKELALAMAYVAAQALDEPDAAARQRMLAAAKYQAARSGRFVGQQAVQLHGGMGMTDELAVGDYFKRLTMIDPLLGDGDHQLDRYGAVLEI